MLLNCLQSGSSTRNQYISTLIINLISLSHGCASGWLSPALTYFRSEDSHLAPITIEEASWIGACLPVGGFCGTLVYGYLAQVLSKKASLLLISIPHMGFWILVYFSTDVTHLYLARVMAGFSGGGVFITVSLFVADIAENHIRGEFGSFMVLSINIGVVIGFIVGAYLPFFTIPIVMLIIPSLFVILVLFYLPDTPHSLMKHHKIKEAKESFMFYRSYKSSEKEIPEKIQLEYDALKKSFETPTNQKSEQKLSLNDFNSKIAIRGLLVGAFLMLLNQFCGVFGIMNYASTIFEASGSTFNPNVSSIFIAVVQLLGACASFLLVEKYGRKILLVMSSLGTGLGFCILAVYSYLDNQGVDVQNFSWIPIFSLSVAVFVASIGILSLPFIVLTEILPKKIRSTASPVLMTFVTISAFTVLKIFPILMKTLDLYGCMLIFSSICIISSVIIAIFLPETKGKNLVNE